MTRPYRGVPAQERRSLRREQLIEAGLEEIGTRGYEKITVKDVCRRAGLTERYFYESFSDRAALLAAVYEHVNEIVMGAALAAAEAAPPDVEARARAGLDAFFAALTKDPRRARVELIEVVGRSEELERRRLGVMREFAGYISRASADLAPDREIGGRERRALSAAVVGATNHLAVEWVLGDLDMSREDLVEALVGLYVAATRMPPQLPLVGK